MTARRVEGIQIEHAADEILVVRTATWEAHALNQSAAAVYRLCDGKTSRPEMAAEIRARTGLPPDDEIVDLALAELVDAQLVVLNDPEPKSNITRRSLIRRLALSSRAASMLPVVETILMPPVDVGTSPTPILRSFGLVTPTPGNGRATPQPIPEVRFVPSVGEAIDEMLALARVTSHDLLYDLGCGDGRVVVTAARKCCCRAVGFDIDPQRVAESQENVRKNGLAHLVQIKECDIFDVDLSDADIVTLYLLPNLNVRLIPQIMTMKPGARVVSQDFDIAGVIPDRVVQVYLSQRQIYKTFYLWTVPLKRTGSPVPREWAQATGIRRTT
jgi:methyltransferase family protein/coenzyme PQQ synthesis protein D (PqqD)